MYDTREQWLRAAAEQYLAPMLPLREKPKTDDPLTPAADWELRLPPFKVSVGWPKGARKAIGQCFPGIACQDGATHHMFISPALEVAGDVLHVLLHELIHAAVGTTAGHKGPFVKLCKAVGLVKPWTATTPSEGLAERLAEIAKSLGPYPHVMLNWNERKKQPTRMLLYECPEGIKIRHAGKDLNATCNDCKQLFKLKVKEKG